MIRQSELKKGNKYEFTLLNIFGDTYQEAGTVTREPFQQDKDIPCFKVGVKYKWGRRERILELRIIQSVKLLEGN